MDIALQEKVPAWTFLRQIKLITHVHDLLIAKLHAYGFSEVSSINKKLFKKSLAKDKGQFEF